MLKCKQSFERNSWPLLPLKKHALKPYTALYFRMAVPIHSTQIHLPSTLKTTRGLIKFKYENHDISAACSGGAVDLRNTLAVGTKIRVADFWFGDHLRFFFPVSLNLNLFSSSISVVKHSINPDLTQDVDFQVVLYYA